MRGQTSEVVIALFSLVSLLIFAAFLVYLITSMKASEKEENLLKVISEVWEKGGERNVRVFLTTSVDLEELIYFFYPVGCEEGKVCIVGRKKLAPGSHEIHVKKEGGMVKVEVIR